MSLHWLYMNELAGLRQQELLVEAARARLAASIVRPPSRVSRLLAGLLRHLARPIETCAVDDHGPWPQLRSYPYGPN